VSRPLYRDCWPTGRMFRLLATGRRSFAKSRVRGANALMRAIRGDAGKRSLDPVQGAPTFLLRKSCKRPKGAVYAAIKLGSRSARHSPKGLTCATDFENDLSIRRFDEGFQGPKAGFSTAIRKKQLRQHLSSLCAENANRLVGIKPLKTPDVVGGSLKKRQGVHFGAPIRFARIAAKDRDLHLVRFINDPDSVKMWLFAAIGLEQHERTWIDAGNEATFHWRMYSKDKSAVSLWIPTHHDALSSFRLTNKRFGLGIPLLANNGVMIPANGCKRLVL
jgi:hypothetical protein